MITQFQVNAFLKKELPQIIEDKQAESQVQTAFPARTAITNFLSYTRYQIKAHHLRKVKKCFLIAEHLYANGDVVVKMLIENLYVYSFSIYLPRTQKQMQQWLALLPPQLNKIYSKQQISPGC